MYISWTQRRVCWWLEVAKWEFSIRKIYIFDSAGGDGPKRVGLVVRRAGEGLLLIRNSDKPLPEGRGEGDETSTTR